MEQEFDSPKDRPAKPVVEKICLHFLNYNGMQHLLVTQQQLIITKEATKVDKEPFVSSKIHSVVFESPPTGKTTYLHGI